MRISVLDQSPIRKGSTAREALHETVQLVQLAERLCYHRFWVSEHHGTATLAGSTPEILMAHLGGQTGTIRLGSGGVMLPHYSALKVAENFRMLETLFPGRIDLGVGRAPGGDRLTAYVLNPANNFDERTFVQQLLDLQAFLNDIAEKGTVQEKVKAVPVAPSVPQQWILSSSGSSGLFAAHLGMGFAFAHFINPDGGPQAVEQYRERFKPSVNLGAPEALVAIFVFCSEDEATLERNRRLTGHRFLQFEKGIIEPVSFEDIEHLEYSPYERQRMEANSRRVILGKPAEVKLQLQQLAFSYAVDELMMVNIAASLDERLRSYEHIAAMGL